MYTTSSELVVFMYWPGESMNNLLSYFGLVDARISTSEKDLPLLPSNLRSLIQFLKILYEGAFFHSYFCKISMELCNENLSRCVWKFSIRNNFNPLWSVGYFEVKENGKKNNKKRNEMTPNCLSIGLLMTIDNTFGPNLLWTRIWN